MREPEESPVPRHRAQKPYPSAEDLLSSMPPMRRDDILALLRAGDVEDDFDWFGRPSVEASGEPAGEEKA